MAFSWKWWASRIPEKINLGKNAVYPVYWSEKLEDGFLCGVTYYEPKQIIICNSLTDKQKVITFFHEWLHAVSYEFDLGLTENQILKAEKVVYYVLKGVLKK